MIVEWRWQNYNTIRPYSYLEYSTPAPEAVLSPADITIEPWLINKEMDKQIV